MTNENLHDANITNELRPSACKGPKQRLGGDTGVYLFLVRQEVVSLMTMSLRNRNLDNNENVNPNMCHNDDETAATHPTQLDMATTLSNAPRITLSQQDMSEIISGVISRSQQASHGTSKTSRDRTRWRL
eukprot:Protomagalhaensia_sp_Gyna_25__3656@NODE_3289_length_637_cov_36_008361_g2758_i0_p1_GENE_NODE_3289_length_637_cov_36_008361_g2758_i0NODE_3289_length_637_cov_36_008361_g2758_i0_p1_ORF_typecomplete_len146_score9_52_NODE_3289_length_637_cov_36_008361_g2758_i051440